MALLAVAAAVTTRPNQALYLCRRQGDAAMQRSLLSAAEHQVSRRYQSVCTVTTLSTRWLKASGFKLPALPQRPRVCPVQGVVTSLKCAPQGLDYEHLIDEQAMDRRYYLGVQSSLCPPPLDLELLAGKLACWPQSQFCIPCRRCVIAHNVLLPL